MTKYTLDTNIISYLFNEDYIEHSRFSPIFTDSSQKYIKNEGNIFSNFIIQCECIGGFSGWINYKNEDPEKKEQREIIMTNTLEFFDRLEKYGNILPVNKKVFEKYGKLLLLAKQKFNNTKKYYELRHDIWIAAFCITHNSTLVTNNPKDFLWCTEIFPHFFIIGIEEFTTKITESSIV